MTKLYGAGHASRWMKCYWMLQELGIEFEPVVLDMQNKQQHDPEFVRLNPFRKVPLLVDGEVIVFEAQAILTYLGGKYPDAGMVPVDGTPDRACYEQWMYFAVCELEQPVVRFSRHSQKSPQAERISAEAELARQDITIVLDILEQQLNSVIFLVGNRFTAADISLSYTLAWAMGTKLLGDRPNCFRYLRLHTQRPKFPAHLISKEEQKLIDDVVSSSAVTQNRGNKDL